MRRSLPPGSGTSLQDSSPYQDDSDKISDRQDGMRLSDQTSVGSGCDSFKIDDQSPGSSPYQDNSDKIYNPQDPIGLYILAFSYDCPAISKLFLVKKYFHEAFMSSALFTSNNEDDFSKFLVESFGNHRQLRIPKKVEEIFQSHGNIAKSTTSIQMSSYQNA